MNFILKGKLKHYTKDVIKTLEIVFLSILFIALIILIKYKPVYTVTLSGETLGYVKEKSDLENRINEYINKKERFMCHESEKALDRNDLLGLERRAAADWLRKQERQ